MAASLEKITEVQKILETLQFKVTTLKKELQKRDVEETKSDVKIDTTPLLLGSVDNIHSLYLLDRRENFFKKLSLKLPEDIIPVSVVHLNDSVYVVGGKEGLASTLFRLTDQFGWEQLADLNVPRRSVEKSCVALNGWIVVAKGGDADYKGLDTVEKYDPVTNTWTLLPKSHYAWDFPRATALDGKLYVSSFGRVECFDPATEIWTVLGTVPNCNNDVQLTSYESDLLVINSFEYDRVDAKVRVWNTSASCSLYGWRLFRECDASRKNFVVYTEGKTIWMVGGERRDNDSSWCREHCNSAAVYNGDSQRWLEIDCLPDCPMDLSLTMVPKKIGDGLMKKFA